MDLPHAPADSPERPRIVPDLRHGARAPRRIARREQPRAGRHEPAILGEPRLHGAGISAGHVRIPAGDAGPTCAWSLVAVDRAGADDARGPLGRLAVVRARL